MVGFDRPRRGSLHKHDAVGGVVGVVGVYGVGIFIFLGLVLHVLKIVLPRHLFDWVQL